MSLSFASLFSGLGGFDLAAEQLGFSVALQAESEKAARRVLESHFPSARLEADAAAVDLRGIDVVTAGFPCQGLSRAASTRTKKGLHDPASKSFVVWAVLDRVAKAKVPYLLLENANSLRTREYAEDMRALLKRLDEIGYTSHVLSLNAGCYGSVMRRVRTFVLARRRNWMVSDTSGVLTWRCPAEAIGVNNMQGGAVFCAQPSVTLKARSYNIMVTPDEVRSLAPEAIEVMFGLTPGWTAPAGSTSARYERLGNAVSVDAARAAISILLTGDAPMGAPTYGYHDLYPLTKPAGGGIAGSAIGRIVRDVEKSRGGVNEIEWRYCLPVYLRWMAEHRDEVEPQMWTYLEAFNALTPRWETAAWPKTATVTMEQ